MNEEEKHAIFIILLVPSILVVAFFIAVQIARDRFEKRMKDMKRSKGDRHGIS